MSDSLKEVLKIDRASKLTSLKLPTFRRINCVIIMNLYKVCNEEYMRLFVSSSWRR